MDTLILGFLGVQFKSTLLTGTYNNDVELAACKQ